MRVLLLSTFHEQCGIATHSEGLAAGLTSAGATVDVLAPLLRRGADAWGDQPQRLWNRNRAFGFEAYGVMRAIRGLRPDLVHAQINLSLFSSRVLYTIARLLQREGIPLVATLHGRRGESWGRNFKLWRFGLALRHADLVVHTDAHRRELRRDRVHVIPHGLSKRTPRPMHEARRSIGLASDRRVVAHFGFLVPDKGVAEMIDAVADLARGRMPDIYYWIAGAVYDSSESRAHFARLQQQVRACGVADRVHLTGTFLPEEQAIGELEAADWIVLNYRTGGSQGASGAARRGFSAGRPVAVSTAPVFDDIRSAARTIEPPLADAVADLFADSTSAEVYAQRGRELCEEHSWERVGERHVALYDLILRRRASHNVIADRTERQHER